jgi:hypothetical protein
MTCSSRSSLGSFLETERCRELFEASTGFEENRLVRLEVASGVLRGRVAEIARESCEAGVDVDAFSIPLGDASDGVSMAKIVEARYGAA